MFPLRNQWIMWWRSGIWVLQNSSHNIWGLTKARFVNFGFAVGSWIYNMRHVETDHRQFYTLKGTTATSPHITIMWPKALTFVCEYLKREMGWCFKGPVMTDNITHNGPAKLLIDVTCKGEDRRLRISRFKLQNFRFHVAHIVDLEFNLFAKSFTFNHTVKCGDNTTLIVSK